MMLLRFLVVLLGICLLVIFSYGSVDEVCQQNQVILCHVVAHQTWHTPGEASSKTQIQTEGDGHEEGSETNNNNDKLLAEESGEEATPEESSKEAVIRAL